MANENGWGDGASNNNIGWGQGAVNNSINWGYLHQNSWAGLTDIYGQSYQAESAAFFTAVEDAGGTLTDNVKAEFDAFVVREKDAGRWSKLKRLYPYLGGKIDSAVIDAVTLNAATNTNFVDADVDNTIGLQGDGSTKHLTDTFIPSVGLSADKFYFGIQVLNAGTNTTVYHGARSDSSTRYFALLENNGVDRIATRTNSGTQINGNTPRAASNDFISTNRENSSLLKINRNQVTENTYTTVDTTGIATIPLMYFGYSNNGSVFLRSDSKIGCITIAEFDDSVESFLFESSYKTFINNIQAYAAAQAYFAAVEASGGTLTTNVKSEFSAFVAREVDANRWSKIKRLYPYLGGKIDSAVIDAVTLNAATNTNFVDADVDATIGLQGDGLSKYLNTDDVMNSIITDNYNWQMGHFIIGSIPTLTSLIRPMGYYRSTGTRGAVYLQIDTSKRPSAFGNWSSINTSSTGSLITNSSHFGARFSASELIVMQDGVKKNTSTTTDTDVLINLPVTMFGFAINGAYQSFSPLNHSGYFLASGMTEADLTAFDTSYKTFINNITA